MTPDQLGSLIERLRGAGGVQIKRMHAELLAALEAYARLLDEHPEIERMKLGPR